jgi:hypothetical protein
MTERGIIVDFASLRALMGKSPAQKRSAAMLFLVSMTVQIPHDVEPERITRLTALGHGASEHPEINDEQAISLPS